jgi:glutamate racemase
MKLGIFDSGLGGLLIAKSIRSKMPDIDIVYFGDTLHLPYGNRSGNTIYNYSEQVVDFLFSQDCALIITACNTASATALRALQQNYLPRSEFKDRRILGVIVPTLETAIDRGYKRLGIIATSHTIETKIYPIELKKIDPEISIIQKSTPLLVPLIENGGIQWLPSVLEHYLLPMIKDNSIECLILGCTHYSLLKNEISFLTGEGVSLISQDEIIPDKLINYLNRHPELDEKIDRNRKIVFYVSDKTQSYCNTANQIFGRNINIELALLDPASNKFVI